MTRYRNGAYGIALAFCVMPLATPASAHVVAEPNAGVAGATLRTAFSVSHGCGASGTVALRMTIPDGVTSVKPQMKAGWTISLAKRKLDPPLEGLHGAKITEVVQEVTWRGGPLPNELYDTFAVMMKLPDNAGTVYFPVVQDCEQGKNEWVEIPAAGQAWGSVAAPAPFVTVQAKPAQMGSAPSPASVKLGDLTITQPWSRATPNGAKVAAGYVTITNGGAAPDRLLAAATTAAARGEVHEMAMNNGVMTMRPLTAGLAIEPGKSVTLAPGGLHMMFMDLKTPLKQGEKLPVTLSFEKAGKIDVMFDVQGIGAQGPAGASPGPAGAIGGMEMDHSAH